MDRILATIRKKYQHWGESDLPDAIRIEPRTRAERISETVRQHHTSAALTEKKLRRMAERADEYLEDYRSRNLAGVPGLLEAYQALKEASEKSAYELRKRVERSAPLVFGTTAASDQARAFLRKPNKYFDVVIVDEAAKAWGIDLVQPLSVGYRAIMVGDHKQLPPFGSDDVDELFGRARDRYMNAGSRETQSQIPESVSYLCHSTRFDAARAWLKPFQRLFDGTALRLVDDPNRRDHVPVTQSLRTQHRSLEAIGRLVSETFYEGQVDTAERLRTRPRDMPLWIAADGKQIEPAVAWIDTSTLPESSYGSRVGAGGKISNDGEARLIRKLLAGYKYQSNVDIPPQERCRIMAPYAAQVGAMRKLFEGDFGRFGVSRKEELDRIVQTVDSAQGAEADLVVVSMTRSHKRPFEPENDRPESHNRALWRSYGFLRSDERLNVMFSRARKQLVIVGNFEYFAAFDRMTKRWIALIEDESQRAEMDKRLGFWGRLTGHFPDTGAADGPIVRIPAAKILGDGS
jgi:superfamily I DNA and/or RNA helicase